MKVLINDGKSRAKVIESALVTKDVTGMIRVSGEHVEYRSYFYYYSVLDEDPYSKFPKSWPCIEISYFYRTLSSCFFKKKTAVKSVLDHNHVERLVHDKKFDRAYHPSKLEIIY